jgi:hypothetical protein
MYRLNNKWAFAFRQREMVTRQAISQALDNQLRSLTWQKALVFMTLCIIFTLYNFAAAGCYSAGIAPANPPIKRPQACRSRDMSGGAKSERVYPKKVGLF